MATRPQKSLYGELVTIQRTRHAQLPESIYGIGKIRWGPHIPDQPYPKLRKVGRGQTLGWQILDHITRLKPQQYIDIPTEPGDSCPHWVQIYDFQFQCRRKGCKMKVVKQLVQLPTGKLVWRIWRVE
jgi:hypothetical protein